MSKGPRRERIKNPKFRDRYDETYSYQDLEDLSSRKKKLGKHKKRLRDQKTPEWLQ